MGFLFGAYKKSKIFNFLKHVFVTVLIFAFTMFPYPAIALADVVDNVADGLRERQERTEEKVEVEERKEENESSETERPAVVDTGSTRRGGSSGGTSSTRDREERNTDKDKRDREREREERKEEIIREIEKDPDAYLGTGLEPIIVDNVVSNAELVIKLTDISIPGYAEGEEIQAADAVSLLTYLNTNEAEIQESDLGSISKVRSVSVRDVIEDISLSKIIPNLRSSLNLNLSRNQNTLEERATKTTESTRVTRGIVRPAEKTNRKVQIENYVQDLFNTGKNNIDDYIQVSAVDPKENSIDFSFAEKELSLKSGSVDLVVSLSDREFAPGRYDLKTKIWNPITESFDEYDTTFYWGVLAVNFDQDVYEPGDKGNVHIGILDDEGIQVCDAETHLEVTDSRGRVKTVDVTLDAKACDSANSQNILPDYSAKYSFDDAGEYTFRLTVDNGEGDRTISKKVEVKEKPDFTISRKAATRLYPFGAAPMELVIYSENSFEGNVVEYLPKDFEILSSSHAFEKLVADSEGVRAVTWNNLKIEAGKTLTISYEYDAPNISPYFYNVGKINLLDQNGVRVYEEARFWEIANDNTCTWIGGTSTWDASTAKWSGCGGLVPQSTDTVSISSGTVTASGDKTIAALNISGGSLAMSSNSLNVQGDVFVSGGTLTTGGGGSGTFGIYGDFVVSSLGTYICNNTTNGGSIGGPRFFTPSAAYSNHTLAFAGTIVSDSNCKIEMYSVTSGVLASLQISGTFTFGGIGVADSVNDGLGTYVSFSAGQTVTFTGGVGFEGYDATDLLSVQGSPSGTVATLNMSGTAFRTGSTNYGAYMDISITDNSTAFAPPYLTTPANSVDAGNNFNVFSVAPTANFITGNIPGVGANITVRLLKNGVDTGLTDDTDASSNYAINITSAGISDGDILTLFLDNETPNGAAVATVNTTALNSYTFDFDQNSITLYQENTTALTNTILDTAHNGDTDLTALYANGGGTTITTTSSGAIILNTGDSYTPGGAVTSGSNIIIETSATMNSAANAVTVASAFQNLGTFTHTGTLTFNGTTAQLFYPGTATIGSDVVISNLFSGGVYLASNLNIGANDLTVQGSSSYFYLLGYNVTATGTFSNNGTVVANGNETISLTQDTNSGAWQFIGDNDSISDNFTLKDFGATDYFNLSIFTNDFGDTFLSSAAKVVAGTFDMGKGNYNANGNTTTIAGITTMSLGGGTYTAGTATQTFNSAVNITNYIFVGGSGTVDINSDLSLAAATFTAPSGTMNILGNFSNNASIFTHNSGTVVFDPSVNHTITGSTSWRNLTFTEASNNTTDSIITFAAASTQTINGTLIMDGLDANDMLNIVSSTSGTAATIAFAGTSTFSSAARNFIDIMDNTLTDASSAVSLPILPTSSVDSGNTTGWFGSITGILYSDEGVTPYTTPVTVKLLVNGVYTGFSDTSDVTGAFEIKSATYAANDFLTIYTENANPIYAAAVIKAGSATPNSGLVSDLYGDFLIVRNDSTGSITNANLDTAHDANSDLNLLYQDGLGTSFSMNYNNKTMLIYPGDTYAPGGVATIESLHISTGSTVSAGTNAITIEGNFDNDGTWTHTGTLTFDGDNGDQTFNPGSATIGSDIVISGTGSSVILTDNNLNIGANNLTTNNGSGLYLDGRNLTMTGTFSNDGYLTLRGSETITGLTQDTNSGSWGYVGDGDGLADTYTIKDYGATDYYNLDISGIDSNDTFRITSALTVADSFVQGSGIFNGNGANAIDVNGGSMALYGGTFTAPSSSLNVMGNFLVQNTFNHSNGTVTLDGDSQILFASGTPAFYRFAKTESTNNSSDSTLDIDGNFSIVNQLTFDGLDDNDMLNIRSNDDGTAYTITMTGASTFSGTNNFLDIKDSNLVDNSSGIVIPVNPPDSINSGNTTGWFTTAISGTVYTDEGVTTMGTGRTVRMLVNGADTGLTDDTDASGNYSISGAGVDALVSGDIVTLYLDGETEDAVTVMEVDDVENQNIHLYQNHIILRHETAGSITNIELDAANNGDSDITSLYTDGQSSNLTTLFGSTLYVLSGETYSPSTGSVTIGGHFDNSGTFTHSGTLTFNGGGAQNFTPGSATIDSNIVLSTSGTVVTLLGSDLNQNSKSVTIGASTTFYLNGNDINGNTSFSNDGTVRVQGPEGIYTNFVNGAITNDSNSGTWEYVGDNDGVSETFTIFNSASGSDFYNLIINDTAVTNRDTFAIPAASFVIAGLLTVTNGTFSIGTFSTTLTGGVSVGALGIYTSSTGGQTIGANFDSAGTVSLGSATVSLTTGSVSITGGTFTSTSGSLAVSEDFTVSGGTFAHNGGTVQMFATGTTDHAITGSISWNNLSITESAGSNNSTDKSVTFSSGSTQTINGALTLDGLDANDMLNIRASTPGTAAIIAFVGTSTFNSATRDFLDIQDNILTDGSSGVTVPINPTSSVDSGNTSNWFSQLTGILRPGEGLADALMNGKTIRLLVNGVDSGNTATTAFNAASGAQHGEFSISKPVSVASGNVLTFYVDEDATVDAVTVTLTNNSTLTGFELIQDTLKVQNENGTSVTNANLNTANNGDTDITAIYADSANLTTASGKDLLLNTGDTFTPGSAVVVGGDIHVLSTGIFSGSTFAISVAGNVDNDGTWTHTGTLTMNGTASQSLSLGSAAVASSLNITNSTAPVTIANSNLNLGAGAVTIGAGAIFELNGFNLRFSSTFSNNGTLRLIGTETVTTNGTTAITNDINSGTWEYTGDGDSAADTITIKDFGGTDYYNLTIASNDGASLETYSSGAAKVIAGAFTLDEGTFNANATTVAVTGTTTILFGNYLTSTATQTFTGGLHINSTGGGSLTMSTGGIVAGGITVTNGYFVGGSGNIDVNGNVNILGGELTASSGTGASAFTVSGNWTNTGGVFTHNSGTVTFDPSTNHTLTGSNSWNNLTFTEAGNNTVDSTITFEAGSSQYIYGTLIMDGLDTNDRLNIVSSIPGTLSSINFTGPLASFSAVARDWLDISDSAIVDNSSNVTVPIDPTDSLNTSNTINWFGDLTGILRPSEGASSALMNGKTIRILKNGVDTGLTTITANNAAGGGLDGEFVMGEPAGVVATDLLTLYVDGDASVFAVLVTRTDGATYSTYELIQDSLVIRHENGTSITNANLDTAHNGDADITTIYANGGGTVLTTGAGKSVIVNTGDTYAPTGVVTIGGGLHIQTTGVYTGGATALSVGGNLDNDGTWTHTGTITFNGTTAQSFNPGSATIGSDLSITNTAGTVTVVDNNLNIGANTLTIATNAIFALGGKNLTMSSTFSNDGTFRLYGTETITSLTQDTNSGTWEYVGDNGVAATVTIKDYGATDYFNLIINDTAAASDTYQLAAAFRVAGNMTVTDGLFSGAAQTMDVDGNLSIGNAGAFTSTSNATFTLGGDFTNAGTFIHNSGTVTLDKTTGTQTITPTTATTFATLRKLEATNDTSSPTLAFAGDITVTTLLNLDGLDVNDRLLITSTAPGTARNITLTGTATTTSGINFLTITDNNIIDSSSAFSTPVNPASSTNGGNTTGWFPVYTGILRPSEGATSAAMNGKTIRMLINGVDSGLSAVTASNAAGGGLDGEFNLGATTTASTNILTFFVDGDVSVDAVTVTRTDAVTYTGFELIQDSLKVQYETGASIISTELDTANNGDTDITAIYANAATLTTASGKDLLINTGDTFAPGSAVVVGGDMHVMSTGIYSGSTFLVSIAGNLDNDGTWTHTGILRFNGTGAQSYNPGSATIGSDIDVNGTSNTVTLVDNNLNIGANSLTIASGTTFALGGKNLTSSLALNNAGTFRLNGSETITSLIQDIDSGFWEYVGDGDGVGDTFSIKDFGTTDYNALNINSTDTNDVFQSTTTKSIAVLLDIMEGTYDANGFTTSVANNTTVSAGGTYLAKTATQTLSTLTVSGGTFTGSSGTVDVNSNVVLSSGTLTAPSGAFTILGNFTNSGGTFIHNSGTVTFDASLPHTLSGTNTWNNLTFSEAGNNATDSTITFAAGVMQTIVGILSLDGLDTDDRLNIVSSSGGSQATLAFTGTASLTTGDFLDILDNAISDSSSALTVPVNPTSSVDSGNNTNWFGNTFSGTVYTDEGVTNIGTGKTVRLLVNGLSAQTTTTNASGQYSFTVSPTTSAGDVITVHLDGNTEKGAVVTRGNAANLSDLHIYQDHIIVRNDSVSAMALANLNTGNDGDTDITALYTDGASPVFQSGIELYV
jgi:hypothetical protein